MRPSSKSKKQTYILFSNHGSIVGNGKKQQIKGEDKKGKERTSRGKKWSPEETLFLIDQVDKKTTYY